ncbi:CDGSH iron-sulfur domain-containing protein [Rhodocyclaceae bacterium SMB388]
MSDNPSPHIAQQSPYAVEVEAGRKYFWCACGQSAKQPFCDGSHKGSAFNPIPFSADKTETVYLCGCKHTGNAPYCDGKHTKL